MDHKIIRTIALASLALVAVLSTAWQSLPHDAKAPYPSMAPLDQYLMKDKNVEIALARTAAPDSISRDATVLVLAKHGYETAVEGNNGFVCAVERGWTGPIDGRKKQGADPRVGKIRVRQKRAAHHRGARRHLLHDVKRSLP